MKRYYITDRRHAGGEERMIDFIGLTSHHVSVMLELVETGEFDTVMFPFNVIEREPEKGLISLARSKDVGTLVMKPLAGGVFTNIEKCFKFLNGYPVDVILNGVASLDELKEDLQFAAGTDPLTPQELKDFEAEVAPLGKDFCRRCSYCLPCPNDILIPVMINLLWPQVTGRHYQDLTDKQKKLGNNLMVWWQACVECGQCEEKCPYNLPIIKRKQELMKIFSQEQ